MNEMKRSMDSTSTSTLDSRLAWLSKDQFREDAPNLFQNLIEHFGDG